MSQEQMQRKDSQPALSTVHEAAVTKAGVMFFSLCFNI